MTRQIIWLTVGAIALVGTEVSGTGFTIVENGQPAATIVLGPEPSETAKAAAKDLQKYVKLMSGSELRIIPGPLPPKQGRAILVGASPMARELVAELLNDEHLAKDGYILKTYHTTWKSTLVSGGPNVLVVVGNGEGDGTIWHSGNGTRFAVFALLEKLGCRFFHPWQDGEHVPKLQNLSVGHLGIVSKPDFPDGRTFWPSHEMGDIEWSKPAMAAWRSWYVKNKLSGMRVAMGHSYHTFHPKILFNEHPEYFALVRPGTKAFENNASEEQKRAGKPIRIAHGQPCLSNPELVKRAVEVGRKHFSHGYGSWSLEAHDRAAFMWCQCDQCRAMTKGTNKDIIMILGFMSQVAEALAKDYPDRLITFYSNYASGGPPIDEETGEIIRAVCHDILHFSARVLAS